jgi:DNA-binding transcriptional ArsR family regulator
MGNPVGRDRDPGPDAAGGAGGLDGIGVGVGLGWPAALALVAGGSPRARVSTAHDDRIGAVFSALADPTRRRVVVRMAQGGPLTASQLASNMPVSRQAVVKHLQALGQAGLVSAERRGREVQYRLDPAPLAGARSWMDAIGARWDSRLEALRRHVSSK